ncbi:MAG: hypothetical protein AVDCRST_MAG90-2135, partial [uncultured Microvirga sp.]
WRFGQRRGATWRALSLTQQAGWSIAPRIAITSSRFVRTESQTRHAR